jgi:hypothetical protein
VVVEVILRFFFPGLVTFSVELHWAGKKRARQTTDTDNLFAIFLQYDTIFTVYIRLMLLKRTTRQQE